MLSFMKELLLLPVPKLDNEIKGPPLPSPIRVVAFENPEILQFMTLILVAPSVPFDVNHTTALEVPVLEFDIVRSLEAEDAGQILFGVPAVLPSIVT
jgi:hypothetical protein